MALGHSLANHYQSMEVKTADPLELVILLYKGAIKESHLAAKYLQEKQTGPRVTSINRAIALIGELQACLDFKKGGEIARSLDRLYTYMIRRLTTANIKQDADAANEVARLMEDLLSGWEGAQAKQPEGAPLQNRPPAGPVRDRLTLSQGGTSVSYSY
ncbi:MAG: flagellar export chaperone FliS [Acidobacteriota bacterium]